MKLRSLIGHLMESPSLSKIVICRKRVEQCELPESYEAYRKQQHRWHSSHMQLFRLCFVDIIKSKQHLRGKLVPAGYRTRVVPLIDENVLVTTSRSTELSSTLICWLSTLKSFF